VTAISNKLAELLVKTGDGTCWYIDGYDDEKALQAALPGTDLKANSLQSIRLDGRDRGWGKLKKPAPPKPEPATPESKVEFLMRENARIEEEFVQVKRRLAALERMPVRAQRGPAGVPLRLRGDPGNHPLTPR
jgi:hypothetical protein